LQPSNPAIAYRPDIDGLRAVAVLLVVAYHLAPRSFPQGYAGVDVFFVISGFLITAIVSRELAGSRFTLGGFYLRRAQRILPALLAMLAAVFAYGWFFLLPSDMAATSRTGFAALFFASNVELRYALTGGYFAADGRFNPLLHTWSLGVEEQFYLAFPLLLMLGLKMPRRGLAWTIAGVALASFATQCLLSGSHPAALFFLAPFRAWELLAGALLALRLPVAAEARWRKEVVQVLGLAAILASQVPALAGLAPWGAPALAVAGAACVIGGGDRGASAASRLLALPPLRYVGCISYSVYLWHLPLVVLWRLHTGGAATGRAGPYLFAASLALGALSYHAVERPFRDSNRMSARSVIAATCIATVLLACVAGAGIRTRGFPARVDEATLGYDRDRYESIITFTCTYVESRCVLGDTTRGPPRLLFWGDSHLLFWGPAIAQELEKQGRSAWFLVETGCAPVHPSEIRGNPRCAKQDAAAMRFLVAHPAVDTVVLGGYWSAYSDPRSGFADDASGFADALRHTLRALIASGRHVALIGDVPGYDVNVPLALALAHRDRRSFDSNVDADAAHAANATFRTTIAPFEKQGVAVADPIGWMCHPRCEVDDGASYYRDVNHLTRAGALRYAAPMGAFLDALGRRPEPLDHAPSLTGSSASPIRR